MVNNVTEETPHACYWCGKETVVYQQGVFDLYFVHCECNVHGPHRATRQYAIGAWNSLASRLKPEPKKRTLKRWVSVYSNGDDLITGATFGNKCDALEEEIDTEQLLDTVEVEITFTDRRNL